MKRNISEELFVATMKFFTRFLNEHNKTFHQYKFVNDEENEIAIQIPLNANLQIESVMQSSNDFFEFRKLYFSEWENVKFTCNSWMMMPELKELLGKDSIIVAFQNLFEIDSLNYDVTRCMKWIFPGYENIDESLPERTTLQRRIKNTY